MIIGAADLHLRICAKYFNRRFAGDALYGLLQLEELAVRKPAAYILAGDVFNSSTPDGISLNAYKEFLDDEDIPVLVLPGNHDRTLPDALPDVLRPDNRDLAMLHPRAVMLPSDGSTLKIDGMRIAGLPYCPPGPAAVDALRAVPTCDLLVTHHAWRHQLAFDGAWHFTLDMLPAHVGMVLNGHVHVPLVQQLSPGRWFCSPGSTWPTLAEEFAREHCVVAIEKGQEPELIKLPTRLYLDLRGRPELEQELDALASMRDMIEGPLRPLVQVSELSDDPDRWPQLHLIQSGLSLAEASESMENELVEEAAADLLANLPAVLDRAKRPEAYQLLQTLLEYPDPKKASDLLQEWLEERLKGKQDGKEEGKEEG